MPGDVELAEVRLVNVPLRLRARAAQHGEELVRELALVRIGAETGLEDSAPQRLLDIAAEVQGVYGVFAAGPNEDMDAALQRGEESADATYRVPRHIVPFLGRVRGVLQEAERYCRDGGHLLTLAPPEEVVAYRDWVLGEFERQIAGEAPRPWSGAS